MIGKVIWFLLRDGSRALFRERSDRYREIRAFHLDEPARATDLGVSITVHKTRIENHNGPK
jgi:hypothetical protein